MHDDYLPNSVQIYLIYWKVEIAGERHFLKVIYSLVNLQIMVMPLWRVFFYS